VGDPVTGALVVLRIERRQQLLPDMFPEFESLGIVIEEVVAEDLVGDEGYLRVFFSKMNKTLVIPREWCEVL